MIGIWRTLRDKPMSIRGIDSLFQALVSPSSFFQFDMVFHAKLATLMAVVSWLLPISAILAPTTLSVVDRTFGPYYDRLSVPNIDLSLRDGESNLLVSMLYERTVDNGQSGDGGMVSEPSYHFRGPSPITKYLLAQVAYGGDILLFASPCGYNCSYSIEFAGPTLKCDKENAPDDLNTLNYKAILEPVDSNSADGQMGLANRLRVISGKEPAPDSGSSKVDVQNILCTPYNATYKVDIIFVNGYPSFSLKSLELQSPLDESKKDWSYANSADSVKPYGMAEAFENWAAMSLIQGIYNVFLGEILYDSNNDINSENTTITSTKLAVVWPDPATNSMYMKLGLDFASDLHLGIEQLAQNVTMSLFAFSSHTTIVTTETTYMFIVFQYARRTLIVTYLVAGVAALLCVFVGMVALWQNGVASDITFSRVLVTTRNPTLDHLSHGAWLGGLPFPRDLLKTKLRFGGLKIVDKVGDVSNHPGLGTADEVVPLRKGENYL